MPDFITALTIEGYRSIRKLEDFPLNNLNVLIGANGAGKSNFISFFRLLSAIFEQHLQLTLQTLEGGADACLYLGPKISPRLFAKVRFGRSRYEFELRPTPDNRFVFADQTSADPPNVIRVSGPDLFESHLTNPPATWTAYHFQDTSLTASVRRSHSLNDNETLRENAENLAAFLYRLQKTDSEVYKKIRDLIRLAAPFFDDFNLRPIPTSPDFIQLEWRQKGSDYPFRAHQLSDGTLRFICLVTALLQPAGPHTLLFDEPELGLHPYALSLIGNLFKQTAIEGKQVIVSTQSASLLNEFEPEDIIVVDRGNDGSTFRRLDAARLSEWLEDYTLGELWQKNVLGGRPHEDRLSVAVPIGNEQ